MNPLTVNPAIALQHARQVREAEERRGRNVPAIRAARAARAALQRTAQQVSGLKPRPDKFVRTPTTTS